MRGSCPGASAANAGPRPIEADRLTTVLPAAMSGRLDGFTGAKTR